MSTGRRVALHRRLYGTEQEYSRRPYGVAIIGLNPQRDELTYDGPRAGRTVPISHPYLGPNSWIRVMPERATRGIINSRADSGETFFTAYIAEQSSADRISSTYDQNSFYYRRLREGEISTATPGIAEQHLSRGGSLSLRGGPLTLMMDVERLEIASKAPTVITRALDHQANNITSEIRFGVAKRVTQTDSSVERFIKITPDGSADEVFAKEYVRNVQSKANPYTLVDHREGHVLDDRGDEETSMVTGKKLRSRTRWGTSNAEDTIAEVDSEGNVNLKLPGGASYGINVEVEQKDLKIILGRDELHNISRNLLFEVSQNASIQAMTIDLEASTNMTLDADVMLMAESPIIQIQADTTLSATATGNTTIGGGSIAIASSSITMGAGVTAGAPPPPTAAPVLRLQPTFSISLDPLITTVSAQGPVVAAFGGTPLAGTTAPFQAIIAYLVALHAELASSGSGAVQVT